MNIWKTSKESVESRQIRQRDTTITIGERIEAILSDDGFLNKTKAFYGMHPKNILTKSMVVNPERKDSNESKLVKQNTAELKDKIKTQVIKFKNVNPNLISSSLATDNNLLEYQRKLTSEGSQVLESQKFIRSTSKSSLKRPSNNITVTPGRDTFLIQDYKSHRNNTNKNIMIDTPKNKMVVKISDDLKKEMG